MTQKKKVLLLAGAVVVIAAVMLGVWFAFAPQGTAGNKDFGLTIAYADGTSDELSISTSQEFLRGALEDEGLIEGTESEYGMYVTTVNGVTADKSQQQWWCFTKDGETLTTGVDSTPVADGDHFEITLTTGW